MNTTYEDVMTIEGVEDHEAESELDYAKALQRQINSGTIWMLQGFMGRTAMDALESGLVMLGKTRQKDYYGNTIPSRDDVKPGTKGSYQLVSENFGPEHADALANI